MCAHMRWQSLAPLLARSLLIVRLRAADLVAVWRPLAVLAARACATVLALAARLARKTPPGHSVWWHAATLALRLHLRTHTLEREAARRNVHVIVVGIARLPWRGRACIERVCALRKRVERQTHWRSRKHRLAVFHAADVVLRRAHCEHAVCAAAALVVRHDARVQDRLRLRCCCLFLVASIRVDRHVQVHVCVHVQCAGAHKKQDAPACSCRCRRCRCLHLCVCVCVWSFVCGRCSRRR